MVHKFSDPCVRASLTAGPMAERWQDYPRSEIIRHHAQLKKLFLDLAAPSASGKAESLEATGIIYAPCAVDLSGLKNGASVCYVQTANPPPSMQWQLVL